MTDGQPIKTYVKKCQPICTFCKLEGGRGCDPFTPRSGRLCVNSIRVTMKFNFFRTADENGLRQEGGVATERARGHHPRVYRTPTVCVCPAFETVSIDDGTQNVNYRLRSARERRVKFDAEPVGQSTETLVKRQLCARYT